MKRRLFTARVRQSTAARLVTVALMLLLCSLGLNAVLYPQAHRYTQLIAVSWGDAPGTPALYGAYVWVEGQTPALQARLTVYIDRPGLVISQSHDTRLLGTVDSPEAAARLWGTLRWDAAGLHVGAGPQAYTFPIEELQRHR